MAADGDDTSSGSDSNLEEEELEAILMPSTSKL